MRASANRCNSRLRQKWGYARCSLAPGHDGWHSVYLLRPRNERLQVAWRLVTARATKGPMPVIAEPPKEPI